MNSTVHHGDLSEMFNYPDDCLMVVIFESLRRLYGKLPLLEYPYWFSAIGDRLHSVQYMFLKAWLAAVQMSEVDTAKSAVHLRFPKFDGVLDKVLNERHLNGTHFSQEQYPHCFENTNLFSDEKLQHACTSILHVISQSSGPDEYVPMLQNIRSTEHAVAEWAAQAIVDERKRSDNWLQQLCDDIAAGITI